MSSNSVLPAFQVPQQQQAQPDGQSDILGWCQKTWDENKSAYLVYHQLVWQAFLMYAGLLWIAWDKMRRMLVVNTPDDEWTPTPNVNYFSPTIDAITSAFQMPEVEAVPQSEADMDAHDVAEVCNALADWLMVQSGLKSDFQSQEDKVSLARQLFVLAGNCFTIIEDKQTDGNQVPAMESVPAYGAQCPNCDTYDKTPAMADGVPTEPPTSCLACGGLLEVQKTTITQPQMQNGQPVMQSQSRYSCKVKIGNPVYALPRPGATNMEQSGWFMWAERMMVDEIKSLFNFDAEPDSIFVDGGAFNYETELSYWYAGYSSTNKAPKDSCMVVRFYVEPGRVKEIPNGGYFALINNKLACNDEWKGDHPVTKGDYLKLPSTFFARSVAFDLMEMQRELNRYEAIIALHAMTTAADPIVADESTKVSEITGRGDVVIWYKSLGPGSVPPQRLGHGSLDEGVYAQRQKLQDLMQNISGAVAVYRGEQPGSVTAASGISQLRGQAEQMFAAPTANWAAMWRETVRKMVKRCQQNMQEWEIAELMGPDHDLQIAKFKKADLDDLVQWSATNFGLPRTRDEKRQELLALFDRGALDITDVNVRQRLFELFGDTGMLEQFSKDATRARKENNDIKNGGQPTFMPEIEDMKVHDAIHSEVIKSLDFDQWSPQAKTVMIQHALATKQALAGAMAAANPATPGMPGSAPAPQPNAGAPGAPRVAPAMQPHNSVPPRRPPARRPSPRPAKASPLPVPNVGAGARPLPKAPAVPPVSTQ